MTALPETFIDSKKLFKRISPKEMLEKVRIIQPHIDRTVVYKWQERGVPAHIMTGLIALHKAGHLDFDPSVFIKAAPKRARRRN